MLFIPFLVISLIKRIDHLNCNLPGFWGGLVPENAFNASALEELLESGVLGLKVIV